MRPNIDRTFETMAMPHLNALFQTALRLKRSRREAECAIETIYADAWEAFKRGAEWTDWRLELFKILCRHVHDIDEASSSGTTDPTALSLEEVPMKFRKPILLVDCQGFTYGQAAEILGVSVETLADRLSLGRDQIAVQMMEASSAVAKL